MKRQLIAVECQSIPRLRNAIITFTIKFPPCTQRTYSREWNIVWEAKCVNGRTSGLLPDDQDQSLDGLREARRLHVDIDRRAYAENK